MISLIMVLHYDKNLFVFLFSESLLFIQIIISRCIFSCFLYHIFFSIFYKWDSIKSFILVILSQYLLIFMSCCSDPHRDFFFNLYYTMTRLTLPSLFCGMLLLFFFFCLLLSIKILSFYFGVCSRVAFETICFLLLCKYIYGIYLLVRLCT